jgi:hypothetical protein
MKEEDLVQASEQVGFHRVVWLKGLGEKVVETVRNLILSFPDLLPLSAA